MSGGELCECRLFLCGGFLWVFYLSEVVFGLGFMSFFRGTVCVCFC